MTEEEWEGWEEVTAVHPVHLAPVYLSPDRIEDGVNQYLHTYLHRYDPMLKSIPVAFSRVDWSLAGAVGRIINDSPQVHFEVRVRWTCFTPHPGLTVVGRVKRIDGSGLTVSLFHEHDADSEDTDSLQVFVPSADLRDEWQLIEPVYQDDCFDGGDDYNGGQRWEALPGAVNQVPKVGASMAVVVSGPGGPTGILGRLRRVKRAKDGFTVTQ